MQIRGPELSFWLSLLCRHSACGLLHSTASVEILERLYQMAIEAGQEANETPVTSLNRRILSSMQPGASMVLLLDLSNSGS